MQPESRLVAANELDFQLQLDVWLEWRLRIALIVECATPVSATNSRGPQPVRLRAWQTRRCTSAGV
jgi:hypothetical protein